MRLGLGMEVTRLSGGGGAPAFAPSTLFGGSDVGAAFDFTDKTTLFQNNNGTTAVASAGDQIGYATDLSGKGKHLTQATAANRPLFQSCAAFDGSNDDMTSPSVDFSGTDKVTIVISVKVVAAVDQGIIVLGTSGTGRCDVQFHASASPFPVTTLTGSTGASAMKVNGDTANTVAACYTFLFDLAGAAAADEAQIRKNGSLPTQTVWSAGPAGAGNFAAQTIFIGALIHTLEQFQGNVYRVIVIGRTLSGANLASAETWVGAGAGLTI